LKLKHTTLSLLKKNKEQRQNKGLRIVMVGERVGIFYREKESVRKAK